jgi:hypothetical protein
MSIRTRRGRLGAPLAAAAVLLCVGSAARAGFPGNGSVQQEILSSLRWVCEAEPATACVQTDGNVPPALTGAECPGGPPAPCVVDFVPDAEIRALLTVAADDRSDVASDGQDVDVAILVEFQIGDERFVLSDFAPGGSRISGWNPLFSEDAIFAEPNLNEGGVLLGASLDPLRLRIEDIARPRLGLPASGVRAVLTAEPLATPSTQPRRKSPEREVDASADGDPLASVARFRVTVRFARTAP